MTLTSEQIDIISSTNFPLSVIARAGSGKTTTLSEFAKKRPFELILYLAFNKEIKKEAKRKFGGNTEVHNIHSLAYKFFGRIYKNKLIDNINIFNVRHLVKF